MARARNDAIRVRVSPVKVSIVERGASEIASLKSFDGELDVVFVEIEEPRRL
jgi:hypothetical protein